MARIPIQQRENVSSAELPSVRDTTAGIKNVVDTGLVKGVANELAKREEEAKQIARAKFKNQIDQVNIQKKSAVADAEGENVFSVSDVEKQNLIRENQKLLDQVPDKWRPEFEQYANASTVDYDRLALNLQVKAKHDIADREYKSRMGNLMGQAVLASNDVDSFEAKLVELHATSEEYNRQKLGGDLTLGATPSPAVAEIIRNDKLQLTSTAIHEAIKQFSNQGDLNGAKTLYSKYKDELLPSDRNGVETLMKQIGTKEKATIGLYLTEQAFERFPGNPSAAADFIKQQTRGQGELYEKAISMYRAEEAFRGKQQKIQNEKVLGDAFEEIGKTGKISEELRSQVDPKDWQKLDDYALKVNNGTYIQTNYERYASLNDIAYQRPEEFASLNLRAYQHELCKRDMSHLEAIQKRIKDKDISDQNRIQHSTDKSIADLVNEVALTRDIDRTIDREEYAKLLAFARQVHGEILTANPKETNPNVIREKVAAELYSRTIVRERRNSFVQALRYIGIGLDEFNETVAIPDARPVYQQIEEGPRMGAKAIQNAHPEFIRKLQEARRRKGKAPLEGEALDLKLQLLSKEWDITKPTAVKLKK